MKVESGSQNTQIVAPDSKTVPKAGRPIQPQTAEMVEMAPTVFCYRPTQEAELVNEARARFDRDTVSLDRLAAGAVSKAGVDLSRLIQKEADAIIEFLDRHWDIELALKPEGETALAYTFAQHLHAGGAESLAAQIKLARDGKALLRALVEGVLAEGLNVGHHDVDELVADSAEFFNSSRNSALQFLGEKAAPRAVEYREKKARPSFVALMGKLSRVIRDNFELSAKPKGYEGAKASGKSADSFDHGGDDWTFGGTKLHHHLGAASHGFATGMNRSHVYYSDSDQGRKPELELVAHIWRQGLNIALTSTYKAYEAGLFKHATKLNRLLKFAEGPPCG